MTLRWNILLLICFGWQYLSAAVVDISGLENNRQLRHFTTRVVEETLPTLDFFPRADIDSVQIVLVETNTEFERLCGAPLPPWVAAVTLFPEKKMIIKSPRLTQSSLKEYRITLIHELVHLIHGTILPLSLTPRWFNEGLATYFSGGFDYHRRLLLSRALLKKQLLDIMRGENWWDYSSPLADLAYAESAAAIEFLITVYGRECLTQILQQIQNGLSYEKCISDIIQDDYTNFPDLLATYLRSRYARLWLGDVYYIFWLVLSLMVVIIYWRLRRRMRAKMAEWQAEESTDET